MSSNTPYGGQPPEPYGQNPPGPYGQGTPSQPPYGYPQQPPYSQPTPGGSGYDFGPFAGQGGQVPPGYEPGGSGGYEPGAGGPGGPGGPGTYGPGQPFPAPPPPKGKGKGLIIGGVIALALILIGVVAAVLIRDDGTVTTVPSPNTSTAGSIPPTSAPPTSAPPPAETASDAVIGYLNALAAGDAAGALSYAAEPVTASPFLTNAVLTESASRAPLTEIRVPEVLDQNAVVVSATYKFGDTDVVEDFDVAKIGDVWKLTRVVKTVELGLNRDPAVPMRINGVKVSGNTVDLLPGSYAFTTGLRFISYTNNKVLIKSPSADADVFSINAQLNTAGKKAIRAAAKASYRKCLRSNDAKPKGCPFAWTDPAHKYRKNAVKWTQSGSDPFDKAKFGYGNGDASVSVPLRVKLSGSCTFSGNSGTCSGTVTGRAVAIARMTGSSVKVRWL